MRELLLYVILVAVATVSCQREPSVVAPPEQERSDVEVSTNYRSYDEALDIAVDAIETFYGRDTRHAGERRVIRERGQIVMRSATRSDVADDEPLMYIFNNEDGMGFTIVSANRSTQPLIAVTEQGSYTYGEETDNEAFNEYMDEVISTYSIIDPPRPLEPLIPIPGAYQDTVDVYHHVDPLTVTKWGQGDIYGEYCPNGIAGCTPTAIAQILAYHQYPASIMTTYSDAPHSNTTINLNWDEILEHNCIHTSYKGCNAYHYQISALLRQLGEIANTDYSEPNHSSTRTDKVIPCLQALGYRNDIELDLEYNAEEYYKIHAELQDDRPVLIRGTASQGGHIWIADGYHYDEYGINYYELNPNYDPLNPINGPQYIITISTVEKQVMLHFNWGWNGDCDGWFNIGVYDTLGAEEYDGTHYQNYNFTSYLMIFTGIEPFINY